jgi:phage shock protein PspC (stress-responsive transcriptional regulator)
VAGVAGGLADWLNAPVAFVRFVIVLLSLYSSVPATVYAVVALVLPARGHNRPSWDNLIGVGRLGLILLIPTLTYGGDIDIDSLFNESPSLWIPLCALELAGLAVLLSADYIRGRPRTDAEARLAVLAAAPLFCFGVALAACVVLFPDIRWERFVPLGVVMAGAALLAGTLRGSGRPFVAPAVVAVVLGAGLTAAGTRLEGGVGDTTVSAAAAADGQIVVRRAMGDVTVDVRGIDASRPVKVVASIGNGKLRVGVPNNSRLGVDLHVGQGRVESLLVNRGSHDASGFDADVRNVYEVSRPNRPRVNVVADVGAGDISVLSGRNFETASP